MEGATQWIGTTARMAGHQWCQKCWCSAPASGARLQAVDARRACWRLTVTRLKQHMMDPSEKDAPVAPQEADLLRPYQSASLPAATDAIDQSTLSLRHFATAPADTPSPSPQAPRPPADTPLGSFDSALDPPPWRAERARGGTRGAATGSPAPIQELRSRPHDDDDDVANASADISTSEGPARRAREGLRWSPVCGRACQAGPLVVDGDRILSRDLTGGPAAADDDVLSRSSRGSRVTQAVVDDSGERPATIDPLEAAHACRARRLIMQEPPQDAEEASWQDADLDDDLLNEKIMLMTISRNPKELADALHRGRDLEALVKFNESEGYSCKYQGVHIFVHPKQFVHVRVLLQRMAPLPKPYHIVVSETYEPLVRNALKRLRSRLDVRPKTSEPLMVVRKPSGPLPYSVMLDIDGDGEDLVLVHNTFLSIPGKHSRKQRLSSCINSSPSASINPRAVAVPGSSCSS
ncbi:unnamed protein product [Prorocentrum cordatum]|uniref:Uncharacterized protein n=1 Tax=Prorocentrum cordatum TaxID=2364126 RepID=A0ABN9X3Y5_9DINO|nr:unnamed protein product [Polarella glacialis]